MFARVNCEYADGEFWFLKSHAIVSINMEIRMPSSDIEHYQVAQASGRAYEGNPCQDEFLQMPEFAHEFKTGGGG